MSPKLLGKRKRKSSTESNKDSHKKPVSFMQQLLSENQFKKIDAQNPTNPRGIQVKNMFF